MAQARQATHATPVSAGVQVIASEGLGTTAVAALRARGIEARTSSLGTAAHETRSLRAAEGRAARSGEAIVARAGEARSGEVIACALDAPPGVALAADLAATCARAASVGRPICLLAPAPRGHDRAALERTAALAYLHAHGAAIAHSVDAWLEAIVLLVRFGNPRGPRAAVVAPAGSWVEAQALTGPVSGQSVRFADVPTGDEPTDVVLYDPAVGVPPAAPEQVLYVPVIARGELARPDAGPALFGALPALAAVDVLGRAAERIAAGLGAAPRAASAELAIDDARLHRQLEKLGGGRLGDHETKVLLASYGVPITRQAVATTPSAAVKLARRAGFPVEIKPWGHDLPSELAGCPVERGLTSDALVRQAFASVLAAAGRGPRTEGAAVVVRETPPSGREVSATFLELASIGWTVVLDAPGAGRAAAPAPLRLADAQLLAAHIVASRAGDEEPDRIGLANLLRRASHLVVDLEGRLSSLELPRIIVGGRGARTVVADASAELRERS